MDNVVEMQKAYHELLNRIKGEDLVFQLSASEMHTTGKKIAGKAHPEYKQKLITGGQEFIFDKIYIGSKGQFIFVFTPMDLQAYGFIEIDEKKVFNTFPTAVDLFNGIEGFDVFESVSNPYYAFDNARTEYLHAYEREQRRLAQKAKDDAELEAIAALAPYEDNSQFGMF